MNESNLLDYIVEIENKIFIDVVKLLPERLPSGKKILWKQADEEMIEIFVDKHSAPGGNPKPIKIKRFIEVNEDLFILLGLWFGDGIRKQATENTIGFSNTEIELHKEFLRVCENTLGLKSEEFKCDLQFTDEFIQKEDEIKSRISRELNIPLKNFWRGRVNERRNTIGIDIRSDSRFWGIVLSRLFNIASQIAILNESFASKFLQGVIASEAGIHVRDSGRLGEISIAVKEKERRDFVRRLLILLGIIPSKDKTKEHQEAVLIHGLSNFRKVKKWNLIILHPKKLRDFERGLKGFKKEEFKKGEAKLLILKILNRSSKSVTELAKELGRAWRSVVDHLWVLEELGFVERKRVSRNVFWLITDKGREILKDKNVLEKLRRGIPKKSKTK